MNENEMIEFNFEMEVYCTLFENPGMSYQNARYIVVNERKKDCDYRNSVSTDSR